LFSDKYKKSTDLLPEDRCHLNGLAMDGGKPIYISGLGKGNEFQSWRKDVTKNGIIMDIESNSILADDLGMPHTPRIYDRRLYCLLSSEQKLVEIDQNHGKAEDVAFLPGFARGVSRIGDYVFVATSKLRKNSSTFKDLDIPESATQHKYMRCIYRQDLSRAN
jgi:uncharacterized protein (TIGR03032 family)